MRNNKYIGFFAASLLATGFASCSNDDFGDNTTINGEVFFSASISKEAMLDETRTVLSENELGNLDCVWSANDLVLVSNTKGEKIGVLKVTKGAGEEKAIFEGSISQVTEGTQKLNFTYLGTDIKSADQFGATYTTIDFSNQEGTMESFSRRDVLQNRNVTVDIIDGMGHAEEIGLKRQVAFSHFELKFPEGVKRGNEPVTVGTTTGDIVNKADVYYRLYEATYEGKPITVNGNGNDLYITFYPGSGHDLTFSVTIDGKLYTGSLASREWTAGEYVRLESFKGVPVEMTTEAEQEPVISWIDLGLPSGRLWADKNLGAVNPEDAGDYYLYGAIEPLSSSNYDPPYSYEKVNTYYYNDVKGTIYLGYQYTYSNGKYKSYYDWYSIEGDADVDAVTANFGKAYHMPNPDDFAELVQNCTWTATTVNGKSVYKVTGTNGNHIILPRAGALGKDKNMLDSSVGTGYYWLSWIDAFVKRGVATQIGNNFKSASVKAGPLDYNQFYLTIRGVKH